MTGYRSWKRRDVHICHMLKAYGVTDSHVCTSLEEGTEVSKENPQLCNCLWISLNFWKRCIPGSELVEKRIKGREVHTLTSLIQEKRSLLLNPSTNTKPWYMVPGAEHWQACWMGWPRAQKSDSKVSACLDCLVVYSLFTSAMTFLLE